MYSAVSLFMTAFFFLCITLYTIQGDLATAVTIFLLQETVPLNNELPTVSQLLYPHQGG